MWPFDLLWGWTDGAVTVTQYPVRVEDDSQARYTVADSSHARYGVSDS